MDCAKPFKTKNRDEIDLDSPNTNLKKVLIEIFERQPKMAFILGVRSYSSDTRGPIKMKLWGCIELALRLCIVKFYVYKLLCGFVRWKVLERKFLGVYRTLFLLRHPILGSSKLSYSILE